jgi:hypothetical protein
MLAFALAAVLSVSTAACGSASSAATSAADASFLASVHDNAPDISSYRSDTALLRLGHAACDGFRGGVSYQVLADRLTLNEGSDPVPSSDLGAVISAAVDTFCPQYLELIS